MSMKYARQVLVSGCVMVFAMLALSPSLSAQGRAGSCRCCGQPGCSCQPSCPAEGPCQSEKDEYNKRVAEQKVTQRKQSEVNSRQQEREVMSSKDEKRIADWKASVKKATKANNEAVEKVNETFKKKKKCEDKLMK